MMSPPTQGRGLKCGEPAAELAGLIGLYARAEVQIVNELGRLRSLGLADYHAEAALNRIRRILLALEGETQRRAGPMIEAPFYADHPEARNRPEPAAKHRRAYEAANDLTAEQSDIVQRLTVNLIGQLAEARLTALATVEQAVLGRLESDVFRRVGLEQTALMEAAGRGAMKQLPEFVEALRRQGLTAFIDKAGRRWSLHGYAGMVLRTTSRQAEILSVLTADPEQDLFQISSHGTTCPLCAPYEGRVYSKSGQDPDFPPLSAAFGKVDPAGPDSLANSWLNIHPNCLHVLLPWTPAGRSPEEIQKIKDFSNPRKNPFSKDPRSQAQIEAYRKKEQARAQWLRDYRQWEKYRAALGDKVPKTFQTFQKHKRAGDGKYAGWLKEYRKAVELAKYSQVRYHEDGTIVVTDDWTKVEHPKLSRQYKPNAVIDTLSCNGKQRDRTIYNAFGMMKTQIHGGNHGRPKFHQRGVHGEHAHEFIYNDDGSIQSRLERELTDAERRENSDIL